MDNDVAIFLDLDNVVIGAAEAGLTFDLRLMLDHLDERTRGRIVLQRAYGDWRQRPNLTRALAAAGFELQSSVRLSNNSKNLADMQLVVDAMSTLVDGRVFATYVLITGDRDFAPLVQALRKRGKRVIGAGIRHTTSSSLIHLCDEYIFYDELALSAFKMQDDQVADLIARSLEQLLQEKDRVPASLLKQRMQALSKGAFARAPQGKKSFHKLLADFPDLVKLELVGTTLYVAGPNARGRQTAEALDGQPADGGSTAALLERALDDLLKDVRRVRASLLKQRLQQLSEGTFDQEQQGARSFLSYLEQHPEAVHLEQEGSTLYVSRGRPGQGISPPVSPSPAEGLDGTVGDRSSPDPRNLTGQQVDQLLGQALDKLLVNQEQVRASLLKQEMLSLSNGAFDEAHLGYETYRHFLEDRPELVRIRQRGTTLLVRRPEVYVAPEMLHTHYRTELKRRGLRVVPSQVRLAVLRDLINLLQRDTGLSWRRLIDYLAQLYGRAGDLEVSKSHIGDVMRLARRAGVIQAENGNSLSKALVTLETKGERAFQEAVIRCDAVYLTEMQDLNEPLNLDEAALALYETPGRARYLQVILSRYVGSGQTSP